MKNKTYQLLAILTLIGIIVFTFGFFLYRIPAISSINLVLANSPNQEFEVTISKESLTQLNEILTFQNSKNEEKQLLSIFERERQHYILLITIIGSLMTAFSLYLGIARFMEKDELAIALENVKELKLQYQLEIKTIKRDTAILEINEHTSWLNNKPKSHA